MSPITLETLTAAMKAEILADITIGILPDDVSSFSELHQHVDANLYGGFSNDVFLEVLAAQFGNRDEDGGLPQGAVNLVNTAQNAVDAWLAAGRIDDAATQARSKMTPGPWGSCAALSSDTSHIRYIEGPDGQHIAKVEHPIGMSQEEALLNAKAIKLVPEMVELVREAALLLKTHREFAVGNSKVHYLALKCQGLLNAIQ